MNACVRTVGRIRAARRRGVWAGTVALSVPHQLQASGTLHCDHVRLIRAFSGGSGAANLAHALQRLLEVQQHVSKRVLDVANSRQARRLAAVAEHLQTCSGAELNATLQSFGATNSAVPEGAPPHRRPFVLILFHALEGNTSTCQRVLDTLTRWRVSLLDVRTRAIVLCALHEVGMRAALPRPRLEPAFARAIANVLCNTHGEQLTVLKDAVNLSHSGLDVHQLVFQDVHDDLVRVKLLQHFAAESALTFHRSPHGHRRVQVFSDYDDTVQAMWVDARLPRGCVYPGSVAFLNAIQAATVENGGAAVDHLHRGDAEIHAELLKDGVEHVMADVAPKPPQPYARGGPVRKAVEEPSVAMYHGLPSQWWIGFCRGRSLHQLVDAADPPSENVKFDEESNVNDGTETRGDAGIASGANLPDFAAALLDNAKRFMNLRQHGSKLMRGMRHLRQLAAQRHAAVPLPEDVETVPHFEPSQETEDGRIPSSIVFVTARPRDYRGVMKRRTLENLRNLPIQHAIVLLGSIRNSASLSAMVSKKFDNISSYLSLFPEYAGVFVGDSGQADAAVAAMLLSQFPRTFRGAFIHDIHASETTGDGGTKSGYAAAGIVFFRTYVQAAQAAYERGLVTDAECRSVVQACIDDCVSLLQLAKSEAAVAAPEPGSRSAVEIALLGAYALQVAEHARGILPSAAEALRDDATSISTPFNGSRSDA